MTNRPDSSIWTVCPICNGDKYCQNEYHDWEHHALDLVLSPDEACPECGRMGTERGKCSACGGDGC